MYTFYSQIQSICPPEIDIACHNSSTSSTISGPAEAMKMFVNQLTKQQYFAKEVACNNIPFHSRYIAHAGNFFMLSRMPCLHLKIMPQRDNSKANLSLC